MKTPTDNIFQLIHSMTAAEKRYFKRHYSSDKNLLTELFNYINNLSHYDEEQVKRNFANSNLSRNLKVYKIQLCNLLLKSLASYHAKKTASSKIRVGLEEVEILLNKQLFELAYGKLRKIKQLCLRQEIFQYLFAILNLEMHFTFFYTANRSDVRPASVTGEIKHYLTIVGNLFRLLHSHSGIDLQNNELLIGNWSRRERSYYRKLLSEDLRDSGAVITRLYYNCIKNMDLALERGNPLQGIEIKKKNLLLFNEKPQLINHHARLYWIVLFDYLNACRQAGDHEQLDPGIDQLKTFTKEHPALEPELLLLYFFEVRQAYERGQFNYLVTQLKAAVEEQLTGHNQEAELLSSIMYIYFALAHLITGQTAKSFSSLQKITGSNKKKYKDLRQLSLAVEWLVLYETGQVQELRRKLKGQRRNLGVYQVNSPDYADLIIFFGKLVKFKAESLPNLAKEYQLHLAGTSSNQENLFGKFFLKDWLTALAGGTDFVPYMNQ